MLHGNFTRNVGVVGWGTQQKHFGSCFTIKGKKGNPFNPCANSIVVWSTATKSLFSFCWQWNWSKDHTWDLFFSAKILFDVLMACQIWTKLIGIQMKRLLLHSDHQLWSLFELWRMMCWLYTQPKMLKILLLFVQRRRTWSWEICRQKRYSGWKGLAYVAGVIGALSAPLLLEG